MIPDSVTSIGNSAFDRDLLSITIGSDVRLSNDSSFPSFHNNGFENTYNNSGKLAGTYIRSDIYSTIWTKQP
jgi:hypothetical protein